MDTDTNIVTHDTLEAEQDIIKRLDGVIEATIKTHEILEAKAKFGFTILSFAMALVLFAFANFSDLAARVSVDAIRLFVLFDLLAVFFTLAVMWPRYQPIAIIQPKEPALESGGSYSRRSTGRICLRNTLSYGNSTRTSSLQRLARFKQLACLRA